jgi:hypothetical protein
MVCGTVCGSWWRWSPERLNEKIKNRHESSGIPSIFVTGEHGMRYVAVGGGRCQRGEGETGHGLHPGG